MRLWDLDYTNGAKDDYHVNTTQTVSSPVGLKKGLSWINHRPRETWSVLKVLA